MQKSIPLLILKLFRKKPQNFLLFLLKNKEKYKKLVFIETINFS